MARIEQVTRNELIDGVRERPAYVPKLRGVSQDTEEYLYQIAGELQHLIQTDANETLPRNVMFWSVAKDGFNNDRFDYLFGFTVDYFEVLYFQEKVSANKAIKQAVDDACAFTCAHLLKADRTAYNDADRDTIDSVRDLIDEEDEVFEMIARFKRRGGGSRDDRDRGGRSSRDRDDRGGRDSYRREYSSDGRDDRGRGRGRDDRDRDSRSTRGVTRSSRSTREDVSWRTSPSKLAERDERQPDPNFKPKVIARQPMGGERPAQTQQAPVRSIGTPVNDGITLIQVLKENRTDWPALGKNYIHPAWDGSRYLSYFNVNNKTGRVIPVYVNISECNMEFKAHDNEIWLSTRREEIRNRPVNYGNVDKKLREAAELKELERMLADLRADTAVVINADTFITDVSVRLPAPVLLNSLSSNYHTPVDDYPCDASLDVSTSAVAYVGVKFNSWGFTDASLSESAVKIANARTWEEVITRLLRLKTLLVPYCWEQLEYQITCRYNQLLMTGLGLLVAVDSFTEDYQSIDQIINLEYPEMVNTYQTLFFDKFKKVALTFDNTALAIAAGVALQEGERNVIQVTVENVLLLPLYSSDLLIRGTDSLVALNRQSHATLYNCLKNELDLLHDSSNYVKVVLLDCVEFYAYTPLISNDVIYISNQPIATQCLIEVIEEQE